MLYVSGKIIWMKKKDVEFTKDGKKESFTENQYMICEDEETPQTVKSTKKISRKIGDTVNIPVIIKQWTSKNGVKGMDLSEIGNDKATSNKKPDVKV